MTDSDLARVMFDSEGRLTARGRAVLDHWSGQEKRDLGRAARRWAVGLIALDLVGLPALALLTPWAWYVNTLVWLAALALSLGLAVWAVDRQQGRSVQVVHRRSTRLHGLATRRAVPAPRHRRDPAEASTSSGATVAS